MRPRRCAAAGHDSETSDSESDTLKCLSCREEYETCDAGTCKECYEEASETEEELKREIEELKAKVAFLRFWSPFDQHHNRAAGSAGFTDVVLVASGEGAGDGASVPVPAHKAVLEFNGYGVIATEGQVNVVLEYLKASRSPVFKAMFENEMEESRSGTIKISDVSYDALRSFVNYLYTAESWMDEQMACELLVLAEKYQVKHLKVYCEKFMVSKLNLDNSVMSYAFAHQHNAKHLLDSALSLIIDNMDKLTKQDGYLELVEKDARLVVEIFEAYISKQVNTAAPKDP